MNNSTCRLIFYLFILLLLKLENDNGPFWRLKLNNFLDCHQRAFARCMKFEKGKQHGITWQRAFII